MRFNPNVVLAATAASAVLLAGCNGGGENAPQIGAPTTIQYEAGDTYDKIVVAFPQTEWSKPLLPENQDKALEDIKAGAQNLYKSSLGKGFDPADVPIIKGGSPKLEGLGEASQLCTNEGVGALQNKIVDAVKEKSDAQHIGERVLTYIVLDGIDPDTCRKSHSTEVDIIGGATTNLGEKEVIVWGDNPEGKLEMGEYLAAHELVHTPPYNVSTNAALLCGPKNLRSGHSEPETSQDIPLSEEDCTVATLRDFNVVSGVGRDTEDMFSGPELLSIDAITDDQIVTMENGQTLQVELDALQNPTKPDQKKLIRIPSSAIMEFGDLTALGGDIYLELSKGSTEKEHPLSVKAYLAGKDVVAGKSDPYSKPTTHISTAKYAGSKNTDQAGEGLSLVGAKGKLSVAIDRINATDSDKGSAKLTVRLDPVAK